MLPKADTRHLPQLPTFIAKGLYTICFIWATCEHYRMPSRVLVILQEFCNQLIEMVATYLLAATFPSCRLGMLFLSALFSLRGGPPRVVPRPGRCLPSLSQVRGKRREGKLPPKPQCPRTRLGALWGLSVPLAPHTDPLPFFLSTSTH